MAFSPFFTLNHKNASNLNCPDNMCDQKDRFKNEMGHSHGNSNRAGPLLTCTDLRMIFTGKPRKI